MRFFARLRTTVWRLDRCLRPAPGGQGFSQQREVAKRCADWLLFQTRAQTQGLPALSESEAATGPGCLSPLTISPAVLGRLRPGQEIDCDPHTGFDVRVAAADAQTVTLETDGPRQSLMFVFDRAQGVLIHTLSRERSTAGTNAVVVHEMQLVGKR